MNDKDAALSRNVGVEEHVTFPELTDQLPEAAVTARGYISRTSPYGKWSMTDKMEDTEGRLKQLDAVGLTLQVLSLPSAGADLLPPKGGLRWARDVKNKIASRVAAHPTRYAGFAHLPLTDPDASADEL